MMSSQSGEVAHPTLSHDHKTDVNLGITSLDAHFFACESSSCNSTHCHDDSSNDRDKILWNLCNEGMNETISTTKDAG